LAREPTLHRGVHHAGYGVRFLQKLVAHGGDHRVVTRCNFADWSQRRQVTARTKHERWLTLSINRELNGNGHRRRNRRIARRRNGDRVVSACVPAAPVGGGEPPPEPPEPPQLDRESIAPDTTKIIIAAVSHRDTAAIGGEEPHPIARCRSCSTRDHRIPSYPSPRPQSSKR
jgi:hypothetical protein